MPTPALNRFVEAITAANPPVSPGRRHVRIMYAAQIGVAPPSFVFFTNVATTFHFSYERFLVNQLREEFGFVGTPIRIQVRRRAKKSSSAKPRPSAYQFRVTRSSTGLAICQSAARDSRIARCSRRPRCASWCKVQPYVLRSWEAEFPDLGVSKAAGGPRVYRRDGRRAGGAHQAPAARRRADAGRRAAPARGGVDAGRRADAPVIDELIGQNARERLTEVKRGLRSILELLAGTRRRPRVPTVRPPPAPRAERRPSRRTASRADRSAAQARPARSRRKRSAAQDWKRLSG